MGLGWIAIGLLGFRWLLGWFNKQLRDSRRGRQQRLREWMEVDDEPEDNLWD